jgi:hypothetical protein
LSDLIDWEFRRPYSNVVPRVPILSQIPFFEQQILTLAPYDTEDAFRREYGLSVSGVVDLWKEKKRLLVTIGHPEQFVGLDYLDPILEKDPPCIAILATGLFCILANLRNGEGYYSACAETAREKMKPIPGFPRLVKRIVNANRRAGFASSYSLIVRGFADTYANLCAFGYEPLASQLLARREPMSIWAMKQYSEYLVLYPRAYALDGVVALDSHEFQSSLRLGLKLNAEVFPVDIAKLISKRLPIAFLRDLGWDEAIELHGQTHELRRLLLEIDECASKGEYSKLPRSEAIDKAFRDARESYSQIGRTKSKHAIIGEAAIGVLGALAGTSLAGLPGLLAGAILSGVGALPLVEYTAEKAAKWKRKAHAVAYYELMSGLSRLGVCET